MVLFDLFKKLVNSKTNESELIKEPEYADVLPVCVDDPFPFPHRNLDANLTDEQLIAEWRNAFEEGVHPIFILQDEQLMYMLNRAERHMPQDTDKSFIAEEYQAEIDQFLANEENAPLMGRDGDYGEPMTRLFTAYDDRTAPLMLAGIPAERPWGLFRLIPFGGWNACPDAEHIADFCQMMYEEFEAVPLMLTGDTLVLLPGRIPGKEEAYHLALKTWPFCPDLIMQEYGSVHALADALTRSTLWRFQWD